MFVVLVVQSCQACLQNHLILSSSSKVQSLWGIQWNVHSTLLHQNLHGAVRKELCRKVSRIQLLQIFMLKQKSGNVMMEPNSNYCVLVTIYTQ